MAGLATFVYNTFFKRTSTFALTAICGAFFFERAFEQTAEYIFDRVNQGKLWKHIKHNYEDGGN